MFTGGNVENEELFSCCSHQISSECTTENCLRKVVEFVIRC